MEFSVKSWMVVADEMAAVMNITPKGMALILTSC